MVTLNNYSVGVSLNADGLIDKSKLARGELASLTRSFTSLATPAERFEKSANLVEKALKEGAIADSTAAEAKERLRQKFFGVSEAQKQAAEAQRRHNEMMAEGERVTRRLMTAEERRIHDLQRLRELHTAGAITAQTYNRGIAEQNQVSIASADGLSMFGRRLATVAAAYVGFSAASNLVKSSVLAAAETEKATAAFSVLAGSAEKAGRIVEGTRSLAARGLSLSALNSSARTMLSFNVAARDVIPTLERIGNITGGDTERLKMLSLAFAQSSAAGRLMGQDLLQMINAGFNPLQEISKKTGRSLVDLKKDMEGGLISFDMVNEAFRTATEEGGLYNGMLETMSKTTAGAIDRSKAKWESLKIQLGESLSPVVRGLAEEFVDLSSGIEQSIRDLKGLVDTADSVRQSLDKASGSGSYFSETISQMFKSLPTSRVNSLFLSASDQVGAIVTRDVQKREEAALRLRERLGSFKSFSPFADEADRLAELNEGLAENARLRAERSAMEEEEAAKEERRRKSQTSAPTKEAEAREKAADKLHKKYVAEEARLQAQLAKLEESKTAAQELKATLAGYSEPERRRLTYLMSQIEALEKQKKLAKEEATLREKMARDAERFREKLNTDAEKYRDKFYTPTEKLAKTFADIDRLTRAGALSQFESRRAKNQALGESLKDVKVELPKNLELGSQEAYKFFAERSNRTQEAAIRAERKQELERQINAINGVKDSVNQLANNIKRKR